MKKVFKNISAIAFFGVLLVSCTKNEDSPGVEYMPDMYRSPAIEAYVDYGEIRNGDDPELRKTQSALTPPNGTIPYQSDFEKARVNMPLPFKAPYGSDKSHGLYGWDMYGSNEETEEAKNTVVKDYVNPIEPTETVMAEGKELYTRMCAHCHGDKGDGNGPIVENGKLTGVANLTAPPNAGNSDGLLFYYTSYGKGVMGAHAMLMTREERWKVVHHLRKFQDGDYPNVTEPVVEESDSTSAEEIDGAEMP